MLELNNINKTVDGVRHAVDINATFRRGTTNLLLGPTGSGKTTLMRLLAGLEKPDSGRIQLNGQNLADIPVQKRNVAMVYQQFINYPSLTVFENIASPLRIAHVSRPQIRRRVDEAASLLKISPYLKRMPSELSGGQQQRVALARALVKNAQLVLLDEPLANLDYKLREELREELPAYFHSTGAVLLYATTEPGEALVLGGETVLLHEGRIIEAGPTREIFHHPQNLRSAMTFSDPPLNTAPAVAHNGKLSTHGTGMEFDIGRPDLPDGNYTLGLRPYHLRLARSLAREIELRGNVVVNEITGSESYLHLRIGANTWTCLVHAIRNEKPGQAIQCFVDPADCFLFASDGQVVRTPDTNRAPN